MSLSRRLAGDASSQPSPLSTVPLLSCVVDVDPPTSGVPVTSSSERDVTRAPPPHYDACCTPAKVDATAAAAKREFLPSVSTSSVSLDWIFNLYAMQCGRSICIDVL